MKTKQQLGMNYSTAMSRLKKLILFDLIQKVGKDVCFQCGRIIEDSKDMSVEHKIPWKNNDPKLFWDLDNIEFSHFLCNSKAGGLHRKNLGR